MSDDLEGMRQACRQPIPRPEFGDGSGFRGYTDGQLGPISMKEVASKPAPKAFTWDDARDIATFVRDGLLMIVKGLERKFDLGKK